MTYKISAQAIWETSKIHGVPYRDILIGLAGMSPEIMEEIVAECDAFNRNVEYPYKAVEGGKTVIIESDGSVHLK